jgi:hypothetical protein
MASSVTGIILLVLAAFLLLRGTPGVIELLQSRGWREVPGTIVGSGVQTYMSQAGGGHGRSQMARASVAYVYEAGGRQFTGTRIGFGAPVGLGMGLGGLARAQADRYPAGAQVTVWVDPHDPASAVLRRSAPESLVMTLAGVAVAILGVLNL